VALQYGVPLRDLVNKFAHVRFEPSGFTGNQEIPIAKSIIDYIFRWLASRFLGADDKAALGLIDRSASSEASPTGFGAAGFGAPQSPSAPLNLSQPADLRQPDSTAPATDKSDQPKASTAVGVAPRAEPTTEQSTETKSGAASAVDANSPAVAASVVTGGASSAARDELAVVATNGQANGHATKANGNGAGVVTLSLGATNVAFKIQEDAPSCAECGSIMVRNGSCYKCLNCGSTSGCS
jgi:ribonucleoside-diphosphate reductase alpha chain